MNQLHLPHQLREDSVNRYAHVIKMYVEGYPTKIITVDPAPFSAATYCARLRDALASYLKFGWQADFDIERLREIRGDTEVSLTENGLVAIKSKTVKGKAGDIVDILSGLDASETVMTAASNDVIAAWATLIHHGAWKKPVKFKQYNTEQRAFFNQLEANLNIGLAYEEGAIIML